MLNVSAKHNKLPGLCGDVETARRRAGIIRSIRKYYDEREFIEIETPVLIKAPAPEEYIESIQGEGGFLRTSPELQMKPLLASGYEKIYQLGSCFRKDEYGRRHRPEFTMLEWYQADVNYRQLLDFTAAMITSVAIENCGSGTIEYAERRIDLSAEPEIITVSDAYEKYAGMSWQEAEKQDIFDELMVTRIEPELGKERMTFLIDYPAERAALSRLKADDPVYAERWELYICGLELANAFGELTDPVEQKIRFHQATEIRQKNGFVAYPYPAEFFEALETGLPECSGCALGVDRLVMVLTGADDIGSVRFPQT
jgi:lysyl-tRNA synthetase class 2